MVPHTFVSWFILWFEMVGCLALWWSITLVRFDKQLLAWGRRLIIGRLGQFCFYSKPPYLACKTMVPSIISQEKASAMPVADSIGCSNRKPDSWTTCRCCWQHRDWMNSTNTLTRHRAAPALKGCPGEVGL